MKQDENDEQVMSVINVNDYYNDKMIITRAKSPSNEKAHFICLQPSAIDSRISNLIDKCFQLSLADRNFIKKKYQEADPILVKLFEKYQKDECSLKLQMQLKKYLNNLRGTAQSRQIRDRLMGKEANPQSKIPRNLMQHSCSVRNTVVRDKSKPRVPSVKNQPLSPKKPMQINITSPCKVSGNILFASVKNKLKFKNEVQQVLDPIKSSSKYNVVLPFKNSEQQSRKSPPKALVISDRQSTAFCSLQSPPSAITTGASFQSPRVIQVQLDEFHLPFEASSIKAKDTTETSFKMFELNSGDYIPFDLKFQTETASKEIITLKNKLSESYAEDILSLCFKPFGRYILKQELANTLTDHFNKSQTATTKALNELVDQIFNNNMTLSPSTLGQFLQTICLQKTTKTRNIMKSISSSQTITIADIYSYFSKFQQAAERKLKILFQQDLQMLVLESNANQSLSYWDLYLMENSRCWAELWNILKFS